jgi:hypothetical protein
MSRIGIDVGGTTAVKTATTEGVSGGVKRRSPRR